MKADIALGHRAQDILLSIVDGTYGITHVATDRLDRPADDYKSWTLTIRTNINHELTFWMEGFNIASCKEVVDANGDHLIHRGNPLAIIDWLSGSEALALDQVVLTALNQVLPA